MVQACFTAVSDDEWMKPSLALWPLQIDSVPASFVHTIDNTLAYAESP